MAIRLSHRVFQYRWLIFSIMAAAYFSAFFHRVSPSVVALDIQHEYGISAGLVGVLASAYFYSYAFIQFPAGLLSDSLGARAALSLFLFAGALGSILFGFAADLTEAVLGRIMIGLGAGMVFTPSMKIFSEWFRSNEFARVNSIFMAIGGLGALTAAQPLALLAGWIGWRAAFELIGVATLVLAVFVWTLVRDRPQVLGWPSLAEIDPVYGRTVSLGKPIPLWEGTRLVITEKYFWPIAMWGFCSSGCYFSFGGLWAGPYLMHVYGMTQSEAGSVLNMFAIGIVIGCPAMAYISDQLFQSRKKLLMSASVGLGTVILVLLVLPDDLPRSFLYFLFFCFSAFSVAPGVISITTTKELFPMQITGTSIGTVNLFPFVGGALMQLMLGWILDAYPKPEAGMYPLEAYRSMLAVLLLTSMGAFFSTLFMKETFQSVVSRK